jgi:hypothetical protein
MFKYTILKAYLNLLQLRQHYRNQTPCPCLALVCFNSEGIAHSEVSLKAE